MTRIFARLMLHVICLYSTISFDVCEPGIDPRLTHNIISGSQVMNRAIVLTFAFASAAAVVTLDLQPAAAGVEIKTTIGVVVIQATQPGGMAADCADAACRNGPV